MALLKSGTRIYGCAAVCSNITIGGNAYATGSFVDSQDNNYFVKPSTLSKITNLTLRGTEVPSGAELQLGVISVTRQGISSANTTTFYGLYNKTGGATIPFAGIGLDSSSNLWFGKVTNAGGSSQRASNLFYSDPLGNFNATGNIIAGGSFRSKGSYSDANNTSFYLDLTTTSATNHTILATGVNTDTLGYNNLWGVYLGGTDNRYISNGTANTGPLWIYNGNIYPILNTYNAVTVQTSSTFTNPVLIKLNNNDSTGATATTHLTLANQTGQSTGIYWRFGNQNTVAASIRANDLGDITYNSVSGNYRFQQDFGPYTTNFYNTSTAFMSVDALGNITHPKNVYAAKLIDYDDNTYFVDPNAASTINQLTLKGVFTATVAGTAGTWTDVVLVTAANGGTYISASRPLRSTGEVGYKWMTNTSTIWSNYIPINDDYTLTWRFNGVPQYTMNSAGTLAAINPGASSVQAVTFADVNNSGYYVKPASYSYINSMVLGGGVTSVTTATGLKIVTPNSDAYYNTLYWNNWNWQTDASGAATLWIGTSTRTVTINGNGAWAFNQTTVPGDMGMIGGIVVNGTGSTQLSVMKGTTSGFAVRVSDSVVGDFSLYDKAYASASVWRRSINSREGTVGINANANPTYGLTVGGAISANSIVNDFNPAYTINFTGTSVLSSLNAVQYGWYLNTGTGLALTAGNTFETSAVFGSDYVLGSGSLIDLLLWNFPTTVETYNSLSTAWTVDAVTDVKPLFTSQKSLNSAATGNYVLPSGVSKQSVRFTWAAFSNRTWDALFITAVSGTTPLSIIIESATSSGGPWTTHVNNTSIGTTGVSGYHYLRTQGTVTGAYFRLTIVGNGASAVTLYNISLLGSRGGASGFANRLLNWDVNKNITTYGNITTKIVYDTNNTAYYLAPSVTSNLYTATFAGDVLTQGQGRFTGWKDVPNIAATRYSGIGVEVGVSGVTGLIYSIDRTSGVYSPLEIYGSNISLLPSTGNGLYLGGTSWYDVDNANYYVKPSRNTVISNLKAFGTVQFVNTSGNSYNENIRLPRANDGIADISLATDQSGAGNITGQWNIQVFPLPGVNPAWTGQLAISNQTGTAITIALSNNETTFGSNIYAPRYYTNPPDAAKYYYLSPSSQSYLYALKVGPTSTTAYDVLTLSPDDVTSPYLSYAHTNIGTVDVGIDLNASLFTKYSYIGSLSANANTPIGSYWYTLYQARHRGGAGDGTQYGSQIVIPMTGSAANFTRMFYRGQGVIGGIGASWTSWAEVFTTGATNYAQQYTIYAAKLIDAGNTSYLVIPSGTSNFKTINVNNDIQGWLSAAPATGTPEAPNLPKLGSSEWVYPSVSDSNIYAATVRNAYRQGLYTWVTAASPNSPTGSTNPYFAGVGFGQGTNGSAEIAAYYVPDVNSNATGLYFRTLRNSSSGWSNWTRVLNIVTDFYAANMNQYVRTTDSPTFSNITLTNTPSLNRIIVKSVWTSDYDATNSVLARFVMPWFTVTAGQGAGGIGPFTDGAATGFKFDAVSTTPAASPREGQNGYLGATNINIWIGSSKIITNSGDRINANSLYGRDNPGYYLTPAGSSNLNTVNSDGGFFVVGAAKFGFPSNRSLISIDQNLDGGFANSVYGTVATQGYGLGLNIGNFSGYSISSQSGTISAEFIKKWGSSRFGLHSTGSASGGSGYWWLVVNGNTSNPKMILNPATDSDADQSFGITATAMAYSVFVKGSLAASDNVYAYSDKRKKRDIATIENALGTVLKLRGVTYYRIDPQPEDVDHRQTGVIAQEVQEIFPEVVKSSGTNDELSVAYGNMAGIFIEAIKDLKKELDDLKAELNMLKGNK